MKSTDKVRAEFVLVTPDMAREFIDKNVGNNRKVRATCMQKYLTRMQHGKWCECNGETLKFNRDGNLIDGQHRLLALIQYNKPLWFLLAYNCSLDAFATVDDGTNRKGADILSIDGAENCNILSAALSMVWRYVNAAMLSAINPSNEEIRQLAVDHEGMTASVRAAVQNRGPKGFLSPSIVAFIHYMGSRHHGEELADDFVRAVCSQEQCENDQPIRALRQRLIENMGAKKRMSRVDTVAIVIKAWNAFVSKEKVGKGMLRWRSFGPAPEAFPTIG
jgi:hypothetical protein